MFIFQNLLMQNINLVFKKHNMKIDLRYFTLNCVILFLALLITLSIFICLLKPGFFFFFFPEEAFIIENDVSLSLLSSPHLITHAKGLRIFKIDLGDRILLNNYSDDDIYKIVIDLNSSSIQHVLKNETTEDFSDTSVLIK